MAYRNNVLSAYPKDIRAELCEVHKTDGEIGGRIKPVIQQEWAAKEQEEVR